MSQVQVHNEQHLIEAKRAPALMALRNAPRVRVVSPPEWAKLDKQTASQAKGYAYEKRVEKELQKVCDKFGWKLYAHQWFEYSCEGKVKLFQPDFIIERSGNAGIVIEVKLTYVDTTQQLNTYVKYLQIFGLICFPLTIVKNLVPGINNTIIRDFSEIIPNGVYHLWV